MKSCLLALVSLVFCCAYGQKESFISYYNKGLAEVDRKNSKLGFEYFLKAVRLAEEGSEDQLKAAYKVAYLYNYASEEIKPEVLKWSLVGLAIVKKTHRTDTLAAHMFYRGGRAYELDFKLDSALLAYKETIRRYEGFYGKESDRVSDCYYLIGDVYKLLHDFGEAEKYYEKGLAIREKMKPDEVTLYMISLLYSDLCEVNRKQGEFDKALVYGLRNVAFAESYPFYQEYAYDIQGDIYRDIGNYPEAIALYGKAITLNKKINHGAENHNLASYHLDLAQTLQKSGLVKEAIASYNRGIHIFSSIKNVKDASYISGLQQLGELYLESNVQLALFNFRKALRIVNEYELGRSGYASGLHTSMAKAFIRLNKMDSALMHCQYSLIAASSNFKPLSFSDNPERKFIELSSNAYDALLLKAKIFLQLYHEQGRSSFADKSLSCLAYAEELLILNRSELDTDQSKWSFFDSNFELYEQVISLLYELHLKTPSDDLIEKAFYYMESSKSRMLADALNQAEFTSSLIADDSLIQYLNIQKGNLYHLENQLKKIGDSPLEKVKKDELRKSIVDTDRRIETTKEKIEKKYPSYVKAKYNKRIPSLKELSTYSVEQGATILEYFWGSNKVYALSVNENGASFKCVGTTDSLLRNLKPALHFLQQKKSGYSSEVISGFARQSHDLFKSLISPFSSLLKEQGKIIVIPDGPIGQFPFEILTSVVPEKNYNFSTLDYLVNHYFISYTFSSSYLLNKKQGKLTRPDLLAFGFTGGSQLRSSEDSSAYEIAGSEEELKAIESKFPQGRFQLGSEVTERRFKNEAPDYDFLHLAIHGQGDTEQNYSASLLFRDTDKSQEDALLHWYELFGLNLKARLVVISSCESGIGKTYRGEGMLSMASSFAYAGCRNIVMGLWKVNDRASVELVDKFYENITEGKTVDESITLAKRAYLQNADNLSANPKMWASLVAYGDDQVMEKPPYLLYVTLLVLATLLLFFLSKKRLLSLRLLK